MESLTLEQVYYLTEIIGVIAVVASIIYLAIQVKQSTQATRSETSNVTTNSAMNQYLLLATDTELLDIFQRGSRDPKSLADLELGRFYSFIFSTLLNWQNFYYHKQKNEIDAERWTPWESLMSDVFSLPGFKALWAVRQQYFQKDFRHFVDRLMSKPANPDYKILGVGSE